jgi:MFS family permease
MREGQLGIAMSGMSIGLLVGPPLGGALYTRFGFRAPFICGIIMAVVDLIGRLLIIERKEALLWNVDPAATPPADDEVAVEEKPAEGAIVPGSAVTEPAQAPPRPVPLSLASVVAKLFKSSRATVILVVTLIWG